MGCCCSKSEPQLPPPPPRKLPDSDPPPPPPPPPHLEEETVKEVLSETPTTKPPPIPKMEPKTKEKSNNVEDEKMKKKPPPSPPSPPRHPLLQTPPLEMLSESGEVSEICTYSESISTTTITTEKREDEDGEVQQRLHRSPSKIPRKRSFPGDPTAKHERDRKSPARRPDPSPVKRNDGGMKSAYNTDVGQTTRRPASESNIRPRRDSGESSGRRSRSPATRVNAGGSRTGIGRSPSRRSGRSPARVPAPPPPPPPPPPGNNQKLEENKEGSPNPSANESIENPLVSMECFIFL